MTFQTLIIRAIDVAPDITNKPAGTPHGWVTSLYQKVMARIPESERDSVKVRGLENLVFSYEHVLTPVEEKEAKLANLRSTLDRIVVKDYTREEVESIKKLLLDLAK